MKILVIGSSSTDKYSGVFCRNFRRALDIVGFEYVHVPMDANMLDYPGFDLYIGAGDELLRRLPRQVADIHAMGGIAVDIRTKKLPNKPKTWLKTLFGDKKYQADYVLTHMQDSRSNCFHIGQGLNDSVLYPDHDDILTIYVDHWFGYRNAFYNRSRPKVQKILNQCRELYDRKNGAVRVWYHNSQGIVENVFEEDTNHYKLIPFDELSQYYRKTHIFLPTHRESQGIVGAEIGMCGGLTLLERWMYPKQTIRHIPHRFYFNKIKWPGEIDIEGNAEFTRRHYSFDAYALRIKKALEEIMARQ